MNKQDIYENDPELTKEVERTLKNALSNRSIIEGIISGSYLTTAYYSSSGIAKSIENIQSQNTSIEMGQTALAITSAGAVASVFGACVSAHAGRNLDIKRFTLGAAVVPLFAVWLNSASAEPNNVGNSLDIQNIDTTQIKDIPQENIKLEIEPN